MDCSPLGTSVHQDSPGKNTGVGCYALLQCIFPTQGLNPSLRHCRQILYHLSHQEASVLCDCLSKSCIIHNSAYVDFEIHLKYVSSLHS